MKRPFLAKAVTSCGLAFLLITLANQQTIRIVATQETKKAPPEDLFGSNKIGSIHLEISAKEYDAMQPPGGGFGFFGGPKDTPQPKKEKREPRDSVRNLFGVEFPYAHGEITLNGTTFKKVGLRYAGDGSYFASARNLKRPLRIEFTRFEKTDFNGHQAIDLHSGSMDPTRSRETLAYALFHSVGIVVPRTAFAEITLTVPGKYDKEYLGLYTLVENVDRKFLKDRFQTDKGLLMKPARLRGIDFLGEDWNQYKGQYQPQSEATKEEAKRVVDFARLINQGTDDQFRKEIDSYLDVDHFLRFMATNALLSNLDSFFGLGQNYYLYLHPQTNKFVFIPGDLELSFANFLMMGSPEQLMDLSLTHPYPGDNKLADRLLANKDVAEKYQKMIKNLSSTTFTKEKLLKDFETIEKSTKDILAKETKAATARREGTGGFGPPKGMFAQAPDLKTFVDKRMTSVSSQLSGKSKGYVPQFGFGPPPQANNTPVDEKTVRDIVQAPKEFDVTLFAAPPKVSYPVTIATAPTGEVFVAVDEQGSLGRTPGGGKLLRCIDKNNDGKVDEVNVFAKMEHPRGVVYQNGTAWVMHPPSLTAFHDDNGDGVSDRQETLVTGLTTDMITNRGGDHTTNGIRMGLDGWIYIAVGDYGIKEAKGKDGKTISLRGGGIVRVRPDGTELEIFATGLRNPFDIAIDPFLNLFTRDNTNDGAGWDVRVSQLFQSAIYGYTQLYANFPDEIMPTLGSFGGGGGTGALFVKASDWPEKYRETLFTSDWGRSEVYNHPLKKNGATFDLTQEVFMKIPRATGMDIDASGRLYVASWRGGDASVFVGPNVGFIARVTPKGWKPREIPNWKESNLDQLMQYLSSPNPIIQLHTQREILRRGPKGESTQALVKLASDATGPLEGRVAAIFTLKQLDGKDSHPTLLKLLDDANVREFALKALTDRKGELTGLDTKPFVTTLNDPSPRVRAQALISLGRINDTSVAKNIIPLTSRPKDSVMPTKRPIHNQPDADRVITHLATRALISLNAIDPCLEALDGPHSEGALRALRLMHDKKAVDGLIKKLATARSLELRRGILGTLIRLYHREADYKGSWWGIRPDSTGPYYDRVEWDSSKRIASVITSAIGDSDKEMVTFLQSELSRHKVSIKGISTGMEIAKAPEKETPIAIPKVDPNNKDQIGNMTYEAAVRRALQRKGEASKGKVLYKNQSCIACHTDADGQTPKGPHFVDIGKRYNATELLESILKPSAKFAQGYETYRFNMADGRALTGFVVSESANGVLIRELTGIQHELKREDIESRRQQNQSTMPEGIVNNLTPEQLADLIAYLQSLE